MGVLDFWLIVLMINMALLYLAVGLVIKYGSDPTKPHRRLLMRINKLPRDDSPYEEIVDFNDALESLDSVINYKPKLCNVKPHIIGFCELCGAKRESDAIFCFYCGSKFNLIENNLIKNLNWR